MQRWPRPLTHVGVTVTDLEKAVHWYSDVLGLQVIAGPSDLVGDDSPFGSIVKDIFGADFGRGRLVFLAGQMEKWLRFLSSSARNPSGVETIPSSGRTASFIFVSLIRI
jgi:Glyoxalase/Bleomycin resistance protein/Dioxygenase superfamily